MAQNIRFKSRHYYGVKTYCTDCIAKDCVWFVPTDKAYRNPKFALAKIPAFNNVRLANPYRFFKDYMRLKHYVILGIGAKCGECLVTFWKLFKRLKDKNVIIATSPILKNPAFGYTQQADFYNAVVWLKTRLGIAEFWSLCAYLERNFGRNRKRPFKNAPRTLDLDIIGFKNQRIAFGGLVIPHKEWTERISVKIPLFGKI